MAEPMVGEIRMLAGTQAPPGWACCDGQLLQIRDHSALYAVLGTTYGGDGKSTFALPDLRGRTPVHANRDAIPMGTSGGKATHAISESEIPAHAHGSLGLISTSAGSFGVTTVSATPAMLTGASSAPVQSFHVETTHHTAADPHDNMQPYLGLTFVIALHGFSPSGKQGVS